MKYAKRKLTESQAEVRLRIGQKAKAIRKKLNIGTAKASRLTGFTPSQIIDFEYGRRNAGIDFLIIVAESYGIELTELFTD